MRQDEESCPKFEFLTAALGNFTYLLFAIFRFHFHFSRMDKFEIELFSTVDSILVLLGHKPSVRHKTHTESIPREQRPEAEVRDNFPLKVPQTIKKGARLVKSPSELSRLLDKM